MRSIAVAGVKGSGGVTSTALALAAARAESGPTLIIEADPSGGTLLSWCDQLHPAGDLYDLVMSRNATGFTTVVQRLGALDVIPSWGRSFRLTQALVRPRVPWPVLLGEHDGTVIVDVGRVYPDAPTMGLIDACDVVVLVASSEPAPVATTMEWASRGGRHGSADAGIPVDRLRIVTNEVVGRRRAMSVTPRDLSAVTGAEYLGHLPHDAAALDVICRGGSIADRSVRRSRLVEAARHIAAALAAPTGERTAVARRRPERGHAGPATPVPSPNGSSPTREELVDGER